MADEKKQLAKEIFDLLASALTAGWVKPSLIKRIFKYIKDIFSPIRFLQLSPDDLIKKYHEEDILRFQFGNITNTIPQSVVFDNTKHRLQVDLFEFILDEEHPEFKIPPTIETKAYELLEIQKKLQGNALSNSTTIRLNKIELLENKVNLYVSKANYFDYLGTNYSIDAILKSWNEPLRATVHPGSCLCKLEESQLSNHIGISALVFTADGFLILPRRSPKGVNIDRNKIGPSISGATNFDRDLNHGFPELIYSIMREGVEELGIKDNDIDKSKTCLLGITRELRRAGKPEIFFLIKLNISFQKVEERFPYAEDHSETSELNSFEFQSMIKEINNIDEGYENTWSLMEEFLRLLQEYGDDLALTMLTNLIFGIKYKIASMQNN